MSFLSPRRRRALAAGVLVLALGAAGVSTNLTGAWFTASSSSPVTVSGALLSIGEIGKSSDKTTVAVADVYPMTDAQALANAATAQAKSEWITVRNTGTIPLDWSMQIVNPQAKAPLTAAQLAMFRFQLFGEAGAKLTEPLTLGSRPVAAVPGGAIASGTKLAAGGQSKVEVRVWLDTAAGNEFQANGASFDVVLNAIQSGAATPASQSMTLTATKSGSPAGTQTALKWTDVSEALKQQGVTGTPTYTVQRSEDADFAHPVVVYSGPGVDAVDARGDERPVPGTAAPRIVSLGEYEAKGCVVTELSEVYCWEREGAMTKIDSDFGGGRPQSVYVGGGSACVILETGAPWCWGDWYPGDGSARNSTPGAVVFPSAGAGERFVKVVPGHYQVWSGTSLKRFRADSCGLTSRGEVICWGESAAYSKMTGALAGKRVIDLAGAGSAVCAITDDNTIACWGGNSDGLSTSVVPGVLPRNSVATPTKVYIALPSGVRLSKLAGSQTTQWRETMCVLTSTPEIYCWGDGGGGYGMDWFIPSSATPRRLDVTVPVLDSFSAMPDGICGRVSADILCVGRDTQRAFGDDSRLWDVRSEFTKVAAGRLASGKVEAYASTTGQSACAVLDDSTVTCWGNGYTWLGVPTALSGTMDSPDICRGAVVRADGTCSLRSDANYFYRVTYTIAGIDGWVSPVTQVARG